MEYFPAALEKLVEQFARLPGIGSKSAQRLAFFVLSLPEEEAKAFADAIVDAKRTVTFCPVCRNLTDGGLCPSARRRSVMNMSSASSPTRATSSPSSARANTTAATTCCTASSRR